MSTLSKDILQQKQNKNNLYTYRHTSTFVSALMLHCPIICYQISISNTHETKYGFLSQSLNIHLSENLKYVRIDKLCYLFDVKVNNQANNLVIIDRENFEICGYLLGIPFKPNKEDYVIRMSLYTFI